MNKQTRLHPRQFQVNEAWIAFQLNDEPIRTEQDGSFDVVCLMDAASCFILGNAFVPVGESEPSDFDARRLLKTGWAHKKQFPTTLFLPKDQFKTTLPAEAKRQNISVVSVPESRLMIFIGEARQGFREHLAGIIHDR
jgi:hypothetical protein